MNRSRSTRKRNQDLELRLGLSELEKQNTLLTNQNIPVDNFIVVEDDDDEVQLSSLSSSRIFEMLTLLYIGASMGALKLFYYSSCTLNGLLQQLAPSICFVTMMAHVNKLCYNHWRHESSFCFVK